MSKFKVYRIDAYGSIQVEIVECSGWYDLVAILQSYYDRPAFRVEAYGGPEPQPGPV